LELLLAELHMEPQQTAQLALAAYAAIAASVVVCQCVRSRVGVKVWLLYVVLRLYVGAVFHWRSSGYCPYPAEGPAIIIANHRSPVDPLLAWMNHQHRSHSSRRNVRVIGFLTAREYSETPGLIGWICQAVGCIPTERNGKDTGPTREALRRLKRGELLGIFPEGRINTGAGLLDASSGVAWLALTAKVPVYPVYIHGAPQGENMVEPFYTFSRVRVSYGEAVDLSGYYGRRKTDDLLQEVTRRLMSQLERLGGIEREDAGSRPAAIPLSHELQSSRRSRSGR
jgi:1-acyl-sn-glycerol-3-phosphate acyltransferase